MAPGQSLNYGELQDRIDEVTECLFDSGVRSGDSLGLMASQPLQRIVALLAASRMGLVFFNLNVKYSESTIGNLFDRLDPDYLLVDGSAGSKMEPFTTNYERSSAPTESVQLYSAPDGPGRSYPDEIFAILFTSGSTGEPKGVFHSQENLIETGKNCYSVWDINQFERFLSGMPMFSAAPLGCVIVPSLCFGQTVIFPENRGPRALMETIRRDEPTFYIGTPTLYKKIFNFLDENDRLPVDFNARGTVCGAKVPEGFVERTRDNVGISLFPHYGMTELLAVTSTHDGTDRNSVGEPLVDVDVRIGENDRILVQSSTMSLGLLDEKRKLPVENGWFRTKDRGRIDEQGNLNVLGRMDSMINRGGNNIFPQEIESVLDRHTHVRRSAVVDAQDDTYGDKIVAVVEPNEDQGVSRELLREHLEESLEVYKVPDELLLKESIPINQRGKLDRETLRNLLR